MRTPLLVTVLCVASALIPAAVRAGSTDPAASQKGREYFVRYCASCHGTGGRGDGSVAGFMKTPPADLTRIAKRRGGKFPDAEIARFIDGRTVVPAHGTREMPVWGKRFGGALGGDTTAEEITRGRIGALVDYLRTIQKK